MIDWDDAFEISGHIPGAQDLPDVWASDAAAFRQDWMNKGLMEADLPYGPAPRHRYDLFHPEGDGAGLFVFIHGGYWRRFEKSYWSHLAGGALRAGWTVAMPSYVLAPEARISQITQAIATAVTTAAEATPGPIRIAGHSAGGHLASRMMCEGVLPGDVTDRVARVTSISGLHDLAPLCLIALNDTLRLTEHEARLESPAALPPLSYIPFTAWVGAQERPEFLRQTRLIEEAWAHHGVDATAVYDTGHDHFTVIEALRDPDSPLMQAILS
ncbi:MAG: alpha/beta hydrolase [Pseudomonadota bacterium]